MLSSTYSERLPDHLRPATEKIEKQVKKRKIILAVLVVLTLTFFGLALYFAFSSSIDGLRTEKEQLTKLNDQLKNKSAELATSLNQKKGQNADLIAKQQSLQVILNDNNMQIQDLKNNIMQNCNITYQKLKFNETKMESFTISTDLPAQGNNAAGSHIAIINASYNSLTSFSNNLLPDLKTLDLSSNPLVNFTSNTLLNIKDLRLNSVSTLADFSSNTLSYIKVLNLSNNSLVAFAKNNFPLIQEIDLSKNKLNSFSGYNLTNLKKLFLLSNNISQFKGNNLPNLQEFQAFSVTSTLQISFSNNILSKITSLYLHNNQQPLDFSYNNFLSLKDLTIHNCRIPTYVDFKTNNFAVLESLKFSNTEIPAFSYNPGLQSLKSLQILGASLDKFSNHYYNNLENLTLDLQKLTTFQENGLPALKMLAISNAEYINYICNHNSFPKLVSAQLVNLRVLLDINCFANFGELEEIRVVNHSVTAIDSFNLSKLKILEVTKGKLLTFSNNNFPVLARLTLELSGTELPLKMCERTLQYLTILGAGSTFSKYTFESLREVQISGDITRVLNFQNNILMSLYRLQLSKASILNIKNNSFYRQISLSLYYINEINFSDSNILWDYIVTMLIYESNITSFSNRSMCCIQIMGLERTKVAEFKGNNLPFMDDLRITSSKITTLDCTKMPAVRKLNLSYNILTASIADTILSCNLKNLEYVDLTSNQISDGEKATVKAKLMQRYPNLNLII